jgi:hypothetical protein
MEWMFLFSEYEWVFKLSSKTSITTASFIKFMNEKGSC